MVKYALISVTDKRNIIDIASALVKANYKIIATSGTREYLIRNGVEAEEISYLSGEPEILHGKVKTISHKILAGILADREIDIDEIKKYNLPLIDIVICNLYNFEETPIIENIDIGGVTLIRASAKNYKYVTCVTKLEQYNKVIEEIKKYGNTKEETRKILAKEAFELTNRYDKIISLFFGAKEDIKLRYGENPHQEVEVYKLPVDVLSPLDCKQLQGKELSFNNICDLDMAINIIKFFTEPCSCIIKHKSPCGVAISTDIFDAYKKAYSCDPISSFGGVIGVNRTVNKDLAEEITKIFIEVLLAPGYSDEAKEILNKKKNMRVMEIDLNKSLPKKSITWVSGGLLIQDNDIEIDAESEWSIVTNAKPTEEELELAKFSFSVVRFLRSNAVCIAKSEGNSKWTIGIGGGQPNRVDCVEKAINNMHKFGFNSENSVLASDAFFPFPDSIELCAKANIKCIIQPGGSIRDKEVIDACNKYNISMIFTHRRHFKH